MTLLDQIKADREAGTPGPWDIQTEADIPDGHYVTNFIDREVCRNIENMQDAHRIARVPDMESALIAAGELADTDAVEQMISDVFSEGGGVREAAAYISSAFRRAIGAK